MAGVDNTLAVASLLAEGGAATLAEADLDTLVAIAIADMPAPERARVVVERATTARTVMVDSGLMRLALRNLLANALAFAPLQSLHRYRRGPRSPSFY
jgi:K+-sensing histidine kinase KdpD